MRTRRRQKNRALHLKPSLLDVYDPPHLFRNLPNAYIEREEREIQEYHDFCPCCEARYEEREANRYFEKYYEEILAERRALWTSIKP